MIFVSGGPEICENLVPAYASRPRRSDEREQGKTAFLRGCFSERAGRGLKPKTSECLKSERIGSQQIAR